MGEKNTNVMEYTITLLDKIYANEKEKYERLEGKLDDLISLISNNYELQQKNVEILSDLDEIKRNINGISASKTTSEKKDIKKGKKIINLKDFIELVQKNKVKTEHLEIILMVKNAGLDGITHKRIEGKVKVHNKTTYNVLNRYDFIEKYAEPYPKRGRPEIIYKITNEKIIKILEKT